MNLFLDYQKKIFNFLKILNKKKILKIPENFKNITVELPPKNQKGYISCNDGMHLAKFNNTTPLEFAEILKTHLSKNFKEFKSIDVAGQGFLNIFFDDSFWLNHLSGVIKLDKKYGSNKMVKKKYNIEFVSANPTGPLHVCHCRGAVLGDALSNILSFNGQKVTRE